MEQPLLTEPFVMEFAYKRSLGPVLSQFFEGLRRRRILGARTRSGRVLVPPAECDPATGEPIEALVELQPVGVVTSWSWVPEPAPHHPLDRPFAWALVKLTGADTAMMHAVDAGGEDRMSTGMTVTARWALEPAGGIRDLHSFVPFEDAVTELGEPIPEFDKPLVRLIQPMRLEYTVQADTVRSDFLRGLARGVLLGRRCDDCDKVYVPSRATCPSCGTVCAGDDIELPDTGVVTTFCVVNIPFHGQVLTPPYACAHILIDGADVPLFQIVGQCPPDQIRAGMRVKAHWEAPEALTPSWESLRWFFPTGEPDAPEEDWEGYV